MDGDRRLHGTPHVVRWRDSAWKHTDSHIAVAVYALWPVTWRPLAREAGCGQIEILTHVLG